MVESHWQSHPIEDGPAACRIERLRREDVRQYPNKALREAITNAVMHGDWFNEGAIVFVEI